MYTCVCVYVCVRARAHTHTHTTFKTMISWGGGRGYQPQCQHQESQELFSDSEPHSDPELREVDVKTVAHHDFQNQGDSDWEDEEEDLLLSQASTPLEVLEEFEKGCGYQQGSLKHPQ